jgi:hypothetical protein
MDNQRESRVPTFLKLFLICGALVIFGCVLTPYFTARPGHDQSSYLFEATRLLSGIEPYGPHLTEVSPPTIIWFSVLPVLLGRWMHGSPMFFLRLAVIVLIFGSVAWCVRILRHGSAMTNSYSIGLLACAIVGIEFCIGPYNFGQREHLLIILLLSYVLATATEAVYRLSFVERCGLGVAAGFAIWFKPQDTLILVGLELFLALRARSLRRALTPEFLALVITSSIILMFVCMTPYVKVTLPLLFDTYWAFGTMSTFSLVLSHSGYMLQVLAIPLACFIFRRFLRDWATSTALLACSGAAFYAFAIQHNDWWYHAYPHQALLLLAWAYLLTDFLRPILDKLSSDSNLRRRTVLVASGAVAVVLCAIVANLHFVVTAGTHSQFDPLDQFLAQYKPSTTVYVFSTSEAALSSTNNQGLNWGSRFAHLWMLPAIVQNELGPEPPPAPFKRLSPETEARLASLLRKQSAEDLNYWRPAVVLVEQCNLGHPCQGIEGKDFDMISWFERSPEFASAWSHYERQTGIDNFAVYKLIP